MEHGPEQRKVASSQPTLTPGQVPPSPQFYAAPAAPGRFLVLRRTLRLLVRRLLYGLVRLGRATRPFAAFLVIILLLTCVTGWLAVQLWWPRAADTVDTRVSAVLPAPAVENFIKGQSSYDADLMWSAYSAEYQATQLQRGASKETLQVAANREKSSGLRYVHYDYIGGVPLEGGGGMYFYAVQLELQQQRAKLPIIFTVDEDGKIVRISSPLNNEQ